MKVRLARPEDTEAILKIYGQYIATPVTFETQLPDARHFQERLRDSGAIYPFLACEDGQGLLGYACAHRQAERAAYGWNAELSIYLEGKARRQGIGRELYRILLGVLAVQGLQNIYARITLPNAASERLHEYFGFRLMGVQHNAGYKCGAWHDVAWLEKALGRHEDAPHPVTPVAEVEERKLKTLFAGFRPSMGKSPLEDSTINA